MSLIAGRWMTVMMAASLLVAGPAAIHAHGASTVDQSQPADDGGGVGVYEWQHIAQTFTAGRAGYLDRIELRLCGSAPKLHLKLTSTTDGLPSRTTPLAQVDIPDASVTSSCGASTMRLVSVPLPAPPLVEIGQLYGIVLSSSAPSGGGWDFSLAQQYSGGKSYFSSGGATDPWLGIRAYASGNSGPIVDAHLTFATFVEPAVDADGDGHDNVYDDCDDAVASTFPGAVETYNGVDDDCDGSIDEGFSAFYVDGDGDSWGSGAAVYATVAPSGHVTRSGDCDDAVASTFPGAVETYNGVDDDCDGSIDEGLSLTTVAYTGAAKESTSGRKADIKLAALAGSATPACLAGRDVSFRLTGPGTFGPYNTATDATGAAALNVPVTGWTTGAYTVTVTVAASAGCSGASTDAVVTLSGPRNRKA